MEHDLDVYGAAICSQTKIVSFLRSQICVFVVGGARRSVQLDSCRGWPKGYRKHGRINKINGLAGIDAPAFPFTKTSTPNLMKGYGQSATGAP